MKNKILSLILAFSVFTSFNMNVSANGSDTGWDESSKAWLVPTALVGTASIIAYVGYKLYDYHCFNKIVHINGNGYGENLKYSRPDLEAKRQIRRVFDNELSCWKRYLNSSAPINAVYLVNVANCLVSIRNYYKQSAMMTSAEFAGLYCKFLDKINYFLRLTDQYHKVKISELIRELHETEVLVDEATVLIDKFVYGKSN